MSAVLPSPGYPDPIYFKNMIKSVLLEDKTIIKSIVIDLLDEDKDFRSWVTGYVTADLGKRVQEIEIRTGIEKDKDLLNEDIETIPEKITVLENKVSELEKVTKPDLKNRNLVSPPKDLTDIRADYLAEHITTSTLVPLAPSCIANVETKIMKTHEFKYFMKNVLPEEFRPKNMDKLKNWSKLKSDVFKACEERHEKEGIFVDDPEHDNHEKRLIWARQFTEEEEKEMLVRMGLLPASNYPYDIKEV
jgi:hypothetical protein